MKTAKVANIGKAMATASKGRVMRIWDRSDIGGREIGFKLSSPGCYLAFRREKSSSSMNVGRIAVDLYDHFFQSMPEHEDKYIEQDGLQLVSVSSLSQE